MESGAQWPPAQVGAGRGCRDARRVLEEAKPWSAGRVGARAQRVVREAQTELRTAEQATGRVS